MKKIFAFITVIGVFLLVGCTNTPAPKGCSCGCNSHKMSKGMEKGKNFRAVSSEKAKILQKGEGKEYCPVCGMTLKKFYKTNHAAEIQGETHQYCSIHCMHEEAKAHGHKPKNPRVVDTNSLDFIPAESAFYVVGSKKPATMSMVSKYAFGKKEEAEAFAKKNGGKIMSYAEVSQMVSSSLEKEKAMIHKRQKKAKMMGEKIYNKKCVKTDKRFHATSKAKVFIKENNLCGKLTGKELQQIGLFLSK